MTAAINLLPDIRQKRQRNQEQKRLFTGIIVTLLVVCGVAIVLEVLVVTSLKLNNSSLTNAINTKKTTLEKTDNIIPALTFQAHITSLASLYDGRTSMTNFFAAYSQANPAGVVLTSLQLTDATTLSVNGTSNNYASVAKLARALEQYKADNQPGFTSVNIQTVGGTGGQIGFTLTAAAAPGVTAQGGNQ